MSKIEIPNVCPICGAKEKIKLIKKKTNGQVKGVKLSYICKSYLCSNCNEAFEDGELSDENMANMTDIYKKKMKYLTSKDLIAIQLKLKLSNVDFAKLLKIADRDLECYKNGVIQTKSVDNEMKEILHNLKLI